MNRSETAPVARMLRLARGAFDPPPRRARIAVALIFGVTVHGRFAAAVLAMILPMFYGMSRSLGTVPWPHAAATNAALLLQFPLVHSLLLTRRGSRWLAGRAADDRASVRRPRQTGFCAPAKNMSLPSAS